MSVDRPYYQGVSGPRMLDSRIGWDNPTVDLGETRRSGNRGVVGTDHVADNSSSAIDTWRAKYNRVVLVVCAVGGIFGIIASVITVLRY